MFNTHQVALIGSCVIPPCVMTFPWIFQLNPTRDQTSHVFYVIFIDSPHYLFLLIIICSVCVTLYFIINYLFCVCYFVLHLFYTSAKCFPQLLSQQLTSIICRNKCIGIQISPRVYSDFSGQVLIYQTAYTSRKMFTRLQLLDSNPHPFQANLASKIRVCFRINDTLVKCQSLIPLQEQ